MKNIIIILVVWALAYFAWNYTQEQKKIEQAKQELWISQEVSNQDNNTQTDNAWDVSQIETPEEPKEELMPAVEKREMFTLEYKTDNEFIQLDELNPQDVKNGKIEITGKTLTQVDSIRVTFKNADSDYPDDDYTLNQFSAWDSTFLYRAFSQYQVLDYGTNIYQFIAKSGDQESILELTIYNPEEVQTLFDIAGEKIDVSLLPVSGEYGNPVKISESTVSYSDISGLEISAFKDLEFTCDNNYILSQAQRLQLGTIWWNTCRPNADETMMSYFILAVKDGKFTYSKHYVSKDYYGVLELEQEDISETWDRFETQQQKDDWLKNKNDLLKQNNADYALVKVTDNLFNEITK